VVVELTMQISVREAAFDMQVSENTVRRWIKEDGLPTQTMSGQTSIHRLAFFEWALHHRIARATAILGEHPIEVRGREPLAKAIEAGEVLFGLQASDWESAQRCIAQRLQLPDGVDRRTVVELFLSRTLSDSMSVGDGVVIPHPRRPVILPVSVLRITICQFEKRLKMGTREGEFMTALFVIAAPTVRCHQLLLADLAEFVWDEGFRSLVRNQVNREGLAKHVRQCPHRAIAAQSGAVASSHAG
jgi:nitrogen PTS system EIIA component